MQLLRTIVRGLTAVLLLLVGLAAGAAVAVGALVVMLASRLGVRKREVPAQPRNARRWGVRGDRDAIDVTTTEVR